MNIPIGVLLSNLISLFLLMAVGFAAVKSKVLPASATVPFSSVLLNIAVPCTIFGSMLRDFDPSFLRDSIIANVIIMLAYLASELLGVPLARLLRVDPSRRGTWNMCVTYPNTGFMGFPIILALLGEEGLALAVMIGVGFNLLLYSSGVRHILQDNPQAQGTGALSLKSILCTMINLSLLLGLIFYCLQISLPDTALKTINYLGNMTTPLSMLVVGMNIGKSSIRDVLRDKDAFSASLVRLAVLPLLAWAVFKLIPFANPLVPSVMLITLAMPSAGVGAALAEKYGGSPKLAADVSFLSSLLCIISLPLICILP